MRETLPQAAQKLLALPVGTKRTISINTNDGLTGLAPGTTVRGTRIKDNDVSVEEQTRADGKKRRVVVATAKGKVLASANWQ